MPMGSIACRARPCAAPFVPPRARVRPAYMLFPWASLWRAAVPVEALLAIAGGGWARAQQSSKLQINSRGVAAPRPAGGRTRRVGGSASDISPFSHFSVGGSGGPSECGSVCLNQDTLAPARCSAPAPGARPPRPPVTSPRPTPPAPRAPSHAAGQPPLLLSARESPAGSAIKGAGGCGYAPVEPAPSCHGTPPRASAHSQSAAHLPSPMTLRPAAGPRPSTANDPATPGQAEGPQSRVMNRVQGWVRSWVCAGKGRVTAAVIPMLPCGTEKSSKAGGCQSGRRKNEGSHTHIRRPNSGPKPLVDVRTWEASASRHERSRGPGCCTSPGPQAYHAGRRELP